MIKKKIFCFGFGQVAKSFIKKLILEKKIFDLSITSRQKTHKFEFDNLKVISYFFSNDQFDPEIKIKLQEADYILVSIPPVNGKDIVAEYFNENIKSINNCKWITYLSATSVYGDHKGDWVTEKSIAKPTSSSGRNRLKAENIWTKLSIKKKFPLQIFRLAGIYSAKSNILKRLQLGEVQIVDKKNHFFSRIHVEDIANILFKSFENFKNR